MSTNIIELGQAKGSGVPAAGMPSRARAAALADVETFAGFVRMRGILGDAAALPGSPKRIHGALAYVTGRIEALLGASRRAAPLG